MNQRESSLKYRFNSLLQRYKRAEGWYARPDIPYQEKLKHEPALLKLLDEIKAVANELNLKCGQKELMQGFDLQEGDKNGQMAVI